VKGGDNYPRTTWKVTKTGRKRGKDPGPIFIEKRVKLLLQVESHYQGGDSLPCSLTNRKDRGKTDRVLFLSAAKEQKEKRFSCFRNNPRREEKKAFYRRRKEKKTRGGSLRLAETLIRTFCREKVITGCRGK